MKNFLLLSFLLLSTTFYSQEQEEPKTIEEKIDHLYKTSISYGDNKAIRKVRYQHLKNEILDSLNYYKKSINNKSDTISFQKDSIINLGKTVDDLLFDAKLALDTKNEIQLVGVSFHKNSYQILVWGIIFLLVITLCYFIYKYKNSYTVTKQAIQDRADLEEEFSEHRKKSLIREQKLRRQLQDEINKQRGI